MHDSIFTIESKKQVQTVENRFELERQEQRIDLQNTKLESQEALIKQHKIRQTALIGGLLGFLIIGALIILNYIKIKKANTIIIKQKELIEETNEELHQSNEELMVTLETNNQQKELIVKTNKAITDSIKYAKQIQKAILPKKDKLNQYLPNHFILYKPKDIVSGDFYWTTKVKGKVIVAAADCTGHGVPGGFMSMLGISFLNDIINKEYITHTGDILKQLRRDVINALQQKGESDEQGDGMEIGLFTIDFKNMILQFSGAHHSLYVIRPSKSDPIDGAVALPLKDQILYEIKGDIMPISLFRKMDDFKTIEFQLNKGDKLYMFSDGFIDQFGGLQGKRFMSKAFKELLLTVSENPMADQKCMLEDTFASWKKDTEQIDDVMVLGIQI